MTLENSKRLYAHYLEIGYKSAAEDMLKKHPDFSEKVKEDKPKEVKPKEDKK